MAHHTLHLTAKQAVDEGERVESFSRSHDVVGALPSLKNTEKGVPDGFFLISNVHKIHFWLGLCPGPR